jgi:hypothetical protein
MVRKKFPWAFYRSNKVKLAGRSSVPKDGTYENWEPSRMNGGGMGLAAALFAAVAGVIVGAWAWLGMPVEMPQAPVGPGE